MKALGKIERWLIVIVFMIATAAVVFQIINRNILHVQAAWTEELARYLIIWVSLLAGAYAFRMREHIFVDAVISKYPLKIRFIVNIAADILTIIFSLVIMVFGAQIVMMQMSSGQVSAALKWPMALMYLSIPVGYALTIVEILARMVKEIKDKKSEEVNEV